MHDFLAVIKRGFARGREITVAPPASGEAYALFQHYPASRLRVDDLDQRAVIQLAAASLDEAIVQLTIKLGRR